MAGPGIQLHPSDNVAIASAPIGPLPAGHKFALRAIPAGAAVIKAGAVIGVAAVDIAEGQHVTAAEISPLAVPQSALAHPVAHAARGVAHFDGFLRPDGRVGTRNTIAVLVVGNCGATVARQVADFFDEERLTAFPYVDAVVPYVHEIGCGMEMTGEPMDLLRRTIAGIIRHPNTAAAVVIALGCERNNLGSFMEQEKLHIGKRLKTITIQDIGGTKNAAEAGRQMVMEMLPLANQARRQSVPAAHLVLGLKTGAVDGFCAASVNPVLAVAVEMLLAQGGTAILSESPDALAISDDLAARATDDGVRAALVERLGWWRGYHAGRDTDLNGTLNAAHRAAGFVNVAEKSRDIMGKLPPAPITAVYRYAEEIRHPGLVFMDTPSYDPVSVTGQIAGGATLIAFATGLGSSFGSLPAPTLKLCSNSAVFQRMADEIDINCGAILDGQTDIATMGALIFDSLLRHASGEKTKSELEGMGENEYVPWPIGVLA